MQRLRMLLRLFSVIKINSCFKKTMNHEKGGRKYNTCLWAGEKSVLGMQLLSTAEKTNLSVYGCNYSYRQKYICFEVVSYCGERIKQGRKSSEVKFQSCWKIGIAS